MTSPTATAQAPDTLAGRGTNMQLDEELAALARALAREAGAVHELRDALVRQRDGVAADAIEAVHGSCDDIARLLVTLESAKRLRIRLVEQLVPESPATIDAVADLCGGTLPPAVAEACTSLRREAAEAAREAGVNRIVLQRTVEAGEAFLQALFAGAGSRDSVYRAGERRDDDGSGFLLDRTV